MSNKDTSFSNGTVVFNCNGKLLDFEEPRVMGILNLSPDSFYDGGKFNNEDKWIILTEHMLEEGAHIIDVGAFSSRPGAELISKEEEEDRLLPVVKLLTKKFPNTIFSIDTYRSEIAKLCFENGAGLINDISGGNMDPLMFETVAELKIPYVLMHMQGNPQNMQKNPINKNITFKVKLFFERKLKELNNLGLEEVILDPGFGFGKSLDCNYNLLNNQSKLRINNLPILAGLSRKSMINKVINTTPNEALNGTTALNILALQNGANLLRVHDVKEAIQTIKLFRFYKEANKCH